MHMFIEKDRIKGKCDSCPFNGEIDNKHKISAYIIKNPPEYKPQATKRNQQKIIKVEESTTMGNTNGISPEMTMPEDDAENEKKEQTKASELFSADTIEFGGE